MCIPMLYIRVPNDLSTIGQLLFWLGCGYDLQLANHGLKQAPKSLFNTSFCAYFKYDLKTMATSSLPNL